MKKIIALLLSFVMTLALFTVGTNAVIFSDNADISTDYKDAVDMMASFGVLKGNEDRSFAPRNTLTRAEAAKIITYMLLGTEAADRLTCDAPVFDDVDANFWGAPYIAFCVAQGIINGNGDGTFNPDGKLTGFAFTKMLLGALSFGGNYTGPSWEVAVLEDAKKTEKDSLDGNGLLKLLKDTNLGEEITREKASQMAFNAMFYKSKTTAQYAVRIENGDTALEAAVKDKTFPTMKELSAFMKSCGIDMAENRGNAIFTVIDSTKTLAEDNFEVKTFSGYIKRNGGVSLDEFTTVVDGADEHRFNFSTARKMIGHYVTVYYKDEWTWEKGETDNKKKGTVYTYIDHTIVVKGGQKNLTEKELADLFEMKQIDTAQTVVLHQLYADGNWYETNSGYGLFTANEKHPERWDVRSDDVLLRENENGEREFIGLIQDSTKLINFYITMIDEDEETYNVGTTPGGDDVVKMDAEDPDDNYDKTVTDDQGNSVDWLDYINYEYGITEYNSDTTGQVVLNTKKWGELYAPVELTKIVGKVEKAQLRPKIDGDSYIYINGTKYSLPDNITDGNSKAVKDGFNARKFHSVITGVDSANGNTPVLDPELLSNKEFVFFKSGRILIFAEVGDDTKLIFPTKFYCVDTVDKDNEYDEYGIKVANEDRYEYYVQGVDLSGEEVRIPVKWDYDKTSGTWGRSAGTFVTDPESDGDGFTEEGVPTSGYFTQFVEDEAAFRSADIPYLYSYTMETDSDGKSYAEFTRVIDGTTMTSYRDPDGDFIVQVIGSSPAVTSNTKRITVGANTYLMGSGYSVVSFNKEGGKDLRISKTEDAYKQLGPYTILYGEKKSTDDHYTLITAFNIKENLPIAGDKLIFVGRDFSSDSTTTVTYTDKNGREKTATAYEQYVFIDGKGEWIKTEASSGAYAGDLCEYEIDEYSGLYKNFTRYVGSDWYTGIRYLENNYSLISFGSVYELQDRNVSGATVINTTDYDIKNDLGSLALDKHHAYDVAVKLDDDDEVETVYVYRIRAYCDITFGDNSVWDGETINLTAGASPVFFFKDLTSAQGIKAEAICGGNTYPPVIRSGDKTMTFEGLTAGTYEVTITVNEENCASQVLHFTLQVS